MIRLNYPPESYAEGDNFNSPYISGFDICDEMLCQDVEDNPNDYPKEIVDHYCNDIFLDRQEIYDFMVSLTDYDPEDHYNYLQEMKA